MRLHDFLPQPGRPADVGPQECSPFFSWPASLAIGDSEMHPVPDKPQLAVAGSRCHYWIHCSLLKPKQARWKNRRLAPPCSRVTQPKCSVWTGSTRAASAGEITPGSHAQAPALQPELASSCRKSTVTVQNLGRTVRNSAKLILSEQAAIQRAVTPFSDFPDAGPLADAPQLP